MVLNKAGYHNQYQMVPLQSGEFSQIATFLCLNVKIETELDPCPVSSHSQLSGGFAAQTLGDIHLDKDCILHNIFFRRQQMFSGPPFTISEPKVFLSFRFCVFAFGFSLSMIHTFSKLTSLGEHASWAAGYQLHLLQESRHIIRQGALIPMENRQAEQGEVSLSKFCLPWKTRENQTK